MKKLLFKTLLMGLVLTAAFSFTKPFRANAFSKIKCMVQLANYTGEGAYIVVSVLDADGNYLKTLRVLGYDDEWYPDLASWWKYYESIGTPDIDAIAGATISGGERSIFFLEIDASLIDAGNQLRFETAVEDQTYHETDLQIPLTSENIKGNFQGTGYIRYVRMIAD